MQLSKIQRYYHTLKHLTPRQTLGRVWGEQKRKHGFYALPDVPERLAGSLSPPTDFLLHDPWNTPEAIGQGKFRFLNITDDLGWPVHWDASNQSLLWQFNLHYFHYLHLLKVETQQDLCLQWIRYNPLGENTAWHPYPTSLRIINWCKAGLSHPEIYRSLYKQTAFLARNTEFYHPGNHYLENARALIFAGKFFQGIGESAQWLEKGLEIYKKELPRQVLPDGGYFERSPMYHALMLVGLLDIINLMSPDDPGRNFFYDHAQKMVDFFASLTHPDGNITLFNDSTKEIAPPVSMVLDYASAVAGIHPVEKFSFPETGYYSHRNTCLYFAIDGGKVGPDNLPAHAHADIFSYECSFKGLQFIVDSGVYNYAAGEMRDYVRGTRAHNTVRIDQKNQVEVWGSFRVARRYSPEDVTFTSNEKGKTFRGTFTGYSKLIGDNINHTREVFLEENGFLIKDNITGKNEHTVESLIHLHPDVSVETVPGGFVFKRDDVQCRLEYHGAHYRFEQGWYCPEFGKKIPNQVIVLHNNGGELPVEMSYQVVLV